MPTATPSTLAVSTRRGVITFTTSLEWEEAIAILGRIGSTQEPDSFANSLLAKERGGKYMSQAQVSWVYKLAQDELDAQNTQSAESTSGAGAGDTSGAEGARTKCEATSVLSSLIEANFRGLKRPALRFSLSDIENGVVNVVIKYMTMGRNAGGAWVTVGGELAGKIDRSGEFVAYDNLLGKDTLVTFIDSLQHNLVEMVAEYGKKTGQCSCCGRTLTNQASIDLGIGPICMEKYGLG